MGSLISNSDKIREGKNAFSDWISGDLMQQLEANFSQLHIPWITQGWTDAFTKNYNQALQLEEVFDTNMTKRMFPLTITEGLDMPTIASHYAKGLLVKKTLARKLKMDDDAWDTNQCALGYGFTTHHAVAEFGLSMTEQKDYPDIVIDAATDLLIRRFEDVRRNDPDVFRNYDLNDYLHIKASFPRGRNTGFPILAPGSDRIASDIVMAIDAALASAIYRDADALPLLEAHFFLAYVVFSRYQSTGRLVPMHVSGRDMSSYNFEPRRRIINAGPKPVSMALKPLIKWWTNCRLLTPEGDQDRKSLIRRAQNAAVVKAMDTSRFDLRMGGVKLHSIMRVIWRVTKHFFPSFPDHMFNVMCREATYSKLVDVGYDNGVIKKADVLAINSGSASTSLDDSIGNLMNDMTVTAAAEGFTRSQQLSDYFYDNSPTDTNGDDNIKFFPKAEACERFEAALPIVCDRLGLDIDWEQPTKFSGYLFFDKQGRTGRLWHTGNSLGYLMFPERPKKKALCSFLARYIICQHPDALEALDLITAMMRNPNTLRDLHRRFLKDVYGVIKPFYMTHPNGAMRQMFMTYPNDPDASLQYLTANLFEDMDEVLEIIGHGAAFDFDTSLFGLPDIIQEDQVVDASLEETSVTTLKRVLKSEKDMLNRGHGSFESRSELLRRVLSWLRSPDVTSFVRKIISEGPFAMRLIRTNYGNILTTKM